VIRVLVLLLLLKSSLLGKEIPISTLDHGHLEPVARNILDRFPSVGIIGISQKFRNNSDEALQLTSITGGCSCLLESSFPKSVGKGEEFEIDLFLRREKFGPSDIADTSYILEGTYPSSRVKFSLLNKIHVSLVDAACLFLPPTTRVDGKKSSIIIKKQILVPSSWQVKSLEVEPPVNKGAISEMNIEKDNTLLYDGKWRRCAIVFLKCDPTSARDFERIPLHCLITTSKGMYSCESEIIIAE
jgi:hypothetical protein